MTQQIIHNYFWNEHKQFAIALLRMAFAETVWSVTDTTCMNDPAPSLTIGNETESYQLWLPNAIQSDCVDYTTYLIVKDDRWNECTNLIEVINFFNTNQ